MKANEILTKIRRFLFGWANREFLIFLFFFALAGILWLFTTLNETYEQDIKVPIRYVSIPKNVVLTSPETDTLRVTVRDKGFSLITYMYKKNRRPIDIDFNRYMNKDGTGSVSTTDLLKMINTSIPASASAVAIKPDNPVFYYNYGEKKRVPVSFQGQVMPEQLYFISETTYSPDSITIYASAQKLDSIQRVYTEPLHYKDFRDPLTITTPLQRIKGVKMVPDEVTIYFQTDVLAELSISDIPVVGINMPEGTVLRTFPAKVTVSFVAGMKNYQHMTPEDFLVVADYDEFANNATSTCNLYLRRQPEGIQRVRLENTEVEYLIEEHE